MSFKVTNRAYIIYALELFGMFSLWNIHVQLCIYNKLSAFDMEVLGAFFTHHKALLALSVITFISIYRAHKFSRILLMLFFASTTLMSIQLIIQSSDKLILVLSVYNCVVFFLFLSFWTKELSEPYLNPNFDLNDLNLGSKRPFRGSLSLETGSVCSGELTNWGMKGLFFRFDEMPEQMGKKVTLEVDFQGKIFAQNAKIASIDRGRKGVGIIFTQNLEQDKFTWMELYSILYDRGLLSEYMK